MASCGPKIAEATQASSTLVGWHSGTDQAQRQHNTQAESTGCQDSPSEAVEGFAQAVGTLTEGEHQLVTIELQLCYHVKHKSTTTNNANIVQYPNIIITMTFFKLIILKIHYSV